MQRSQYLRVYEPSKVRQNDMEGEVAFIWTPNDLLGGNGRKPKLHDKISFVIEYPTPATRNLRKFKDGPGVRLVSLADGHYMGWVRKYDKGHLIDRIEGGFKIEGEILEGFRSPWNNAGGTSISGKLSFHVLNDDDNMDKLKKKHEAPVKRAPISSPAKAQIGDGGSVDVQVVDGDSVDVQVVDGDSVDVQVVDGDSVDVQVVDGDSVDVQVVDGGSVDVQVVDGDSVDVQVVDGGSVDVQVVDGDIDYDSDATV